VTIDEQDRQVPFYIPNFDFEQDPEQESPLDIAADLLAKLLASIVPVEGKIDLALVGQKIVAVNFLLNRSGAETMTSIASRAGVSKQILSHHANRIGEKLHFHGANQKSIKCRAIFSEATRQRWAALTPEERKKRRAGKAAQSAPPAA
jgi:hypothetical protein